MAGIIIPSILNCEFSKIKQTLINLFELGVKHLHFDVMDSTLNSEIFDGFFYISQLSEILNEYNIEKNVHLISTTPEKYILNVSEIKVNQLSFHNVNFSTEYTFSLINRLKVYVDNVGLVISPNEEIDLEILKNINFAHICTKDFKSSRIYSMEEIKNLIFKVKPFVRNIQIDGGVTLLNIKSFHKSGINYFVVGSAIFSSSPQKSYSALKKIINK